MEDLHLIAEQTVKDANEELVRLTEEAFQLHDALREQQELSSSAAPEILVHLRQRIKDKLVLMNQEACIMSFDPRRNLEAHFHRFSDCLNGLSLELKQKRNIMITVFLGHAATVANDWRGNSFLQVFVERCDLFVHFPAEFWKHDKAIFLVVVQSFPEFLAVPDVVSEALLNDRDVFLAYLGVHDREIRGSLRSPWDDEMFRRLVCRFSNSIRAERTLMLALVNKSGLYLEYVDQSLKADPDIVRAACIQHPSAINNCSDFRLVENLLHDKSFVLTVLDAPRPSPTTAAYCRQFYMSLPEHMRYDVDIAAAMLRKQYLAVDDFPNTLRRGRVFWSNACQHTDSTVWRLLPEEFKDDAEFLETIRFNKNDGRALDHVTFAFQDCPELSANRVFWTAVIKSDETIFDLVDLIRNHARVEIRHDRNLMLLACTRRSLVYSLLSPQLQQDEEILGAMIEADGAEYAFTLIPLQVQSMYPDLTIKALHALSPQEDAPRVDLDRIAPDLRTQPTALESYFRYYLSTINEGLGGGDMLSNVTLELPDAMKDNEAFGLMATTLCPNFFFWHGTDGFLELTSEALRSNKAFMMKAVASNSLCRAAAAGDLVDDFDLDVVAFSQKIVEFIDLYEGDEGGDEDYEKRRHYLLSIATKAREKVRLFEWYTREFAPLFENYPGNTPPGSNFPALFQNDETAHALKKKILGYCGGLPGEEDVKNLRAASLHLFVTMYPYERGVPYHVRGLPRFLRELPKLGRFFSCD